MMDKIQIKTSQPQDAQPMTIKNWYLEIFNSYVDEALLLRSVLCQP